MKIYTNKKYNTIVFYTLLIVALSLLMIVAIFKFDKILLFGKEVVSALMPVIWGFAIAYLLNPVTKVFEKLMAKLIFKKKPHKKACRRIAVAVTVILLLLLMTSLTYFILPEIIESIKSIFTNFNGWLDNSKSIVNKILESNPKINNYIKSEYDTITVYLQNLVQKLQPDFNDFVANFTKGIVSFLLGIKDFLLGLIVSIYLLLSKETLLSQLKKITLALFSKKTCEKTFKVYHKTNDLFIKFIGGRIIDSFIVGVLCFIGLSILKMPYSILISVLLGITNIIPFFGPFIGAIPSALLVLLAKPSSLIPFLIFILVLQQFDGNVLEPRIIGDSTGLPAFWVLFAIFLGGGLFGFIGMLLGVPTFALIYTLFREFIENKLERKRLPKDTGSYTGSVEHMYVVKRAKEKDMDFDQYLQGKKH